MKILLLHADYIKVVPKKKALKEPEPCKLGEEISAKEVLVVFTSVEEGDSEKVVEPAVKEIKDVYNQVKAKEIMIYPYVHLTQNPAKPDVAKKVLASLVKKLKAKSTPFGYYKQFEIKVKGHPLSELSREISPESAPKRKEIVDKIKKEYVILTPEGKEYKIDLKSFKKDEFKKYPSLVKYISSEELKKESSKEPPSIKAMRKLEMVGYEPASDPGNFRFWPNGLLVYDLLKEYADNIAKDLGCIEIKTPLIYNWAEPDIRAQGESFHEKHYSVKVPDNKKKELVLRFAGDFGLFRLMKDLNLSYKHLPFRVYEFSDSFRYETRGELKGLKRLRAFSMPDIHCFCKDKKQGWEEFQLLYKKYDDLMKANNIEYAVVFRIVKEFYGKNKKQIVNMLKHSKKPCFIELLSAMKHYWAVKHEFQGIDSVGGNLQISTVQLDVEDAKRYGITYTNEQGKQKGCIICHSSIGAIERLIYAVLEEALKNEIPMLPLWLSPVQVRVCSVSSDHLKFAEKVADEIEKNQIRVEIDDRNETIPKKVHKSEESWIPLTVVIGDKEVKSKKIAVRFRESGQVKPMSIKDLVKYVKNKVANMPFRQLNGARYLSRKPNY